jgi:D-3-phosphoglycerate dehydrogenase
MGRAWRRGARRSGVSPFRVGLTRDFLRDDGAPALGDIGLARLDAAPGVAYEFLDAYEPEATPEQIAGLDAVISLNPRYSAATFAAGAGRLAIVARFGVGYDNVVVAALTANDVLLAITPDGVRRPMASAIVALILALAHQLVPKRRLVREGRWTATGAELGEVIGVGLDGRTLGSIGIGNIGAELFRLIAPFGMRHLAHDPYVGAEAAAALGVGLVDLDTLLAESDFVCVNCPLLPATRGLIGERALGRMKPSAFLINTARGPIVDQAALCRALADGRLAGAALDVFEREPLPPDDPLRRLDNVILTPHGIGYTDELTRGCGESAIRAVLAVARGEPPPHVVNREALARPGVQAKLDGYRRSGGPSRRRDGGADANGGRA